MSHRGLKLSAVFAALFTVFLVLGPTSSSFAGSNDKPNEETTGSPTPTPSPTETETPAPEGSTGPTEISLPEDDTEESDDTEDEAEDEAEDEGDGSDEGDVSGREEPDTTTDIAGGIRVTKTANVDSIAAAGGDVSFTFGVQNTANAELQITVLSDDVFGTLSGDADCQVGTVLAAGASCSFTLTEHLSGNAGTAHVNVVTATAEVGGKVVTDVDSETVLFVSGQTQVEGGIRVTKTANVDSIAAAGGDVSFTFGVQNTANAELEITVLSDDVFGTLSGDADCQVGTVLAAGASCSFTLTEHLSGNAGTAHVNVVTATGEVGGKVVTDVDSETVLFVSAQVGGGPGGGGGAGGGGNGQVGAGGGANVLGARVTRTAAPGAVQGALAFTGQSVWILAAIATALLVIGLTMLAIARKRARL